MRRWFLKVLSTAFCCFFSLSVTGSALADAPVKPLCAVYVTGIGCGNCAATDPALFINAVAAYPDLVIVEYEIYRNRAQNQETTEFYFQQYAPGKRSGVPFLVFNKEKSVIGRFEVQQAIEQIEALPRGVFPKWDGMMVDFDSFDLIQMPGAPKIWTKNRILIYGEGGQSDELKKILLADDVPEALRGIEYQTVKPEPVAISQGKIDFDYAVMIGNWRLQWSGQPLKAVAAGSKTQAASASLLVVSLLVLAVSFSFFKIGLRKTPKGAPIKVEFRGRIRDFIISLTALVALTIFFIAAKNVTPDFLERIGYEMPLPVFTFLIALVDGFNPCNMFVLTCLLALLISTSDSKLRLYVVALSFVGMCYIFYFLFMALWLNVFKYISFVTPLRIGLGALAVVAGVINCKELFFFKKGISLTIQEQHKGPLMKRLQAMKEIIQKGSLPLLISSSIGLATLASLVELPCTAGFPIIFTGILSGKGLENTASYYFYLAYYNLIYVLPLCVIVFIFIYTLKARQITQRQMEVIKFIGGVIMLLLGLVLLVNPGLLGLKIG